jgi:hypothetical protein
MEGRVRKEFNHGEHGEHGERQKRISHNGHDEHNEKQNLEPLTTEAQRHRESQKQILCFSLAFLCASVVNGFDSAFLCVSVSLWLMVLHVFSLCPLCSLWLIQK